MYIRVSDRRLAIVWGGACALALQLAGPLEALARAGGGSHFGGGHSSGSYHSSGGPYGGGGLFSFWPLLFFGHGSGLTGLIVLIVIIYLVNQYQSGRVSGPIIPVTNDSVSMAEAAQLPLEAVRPSFDPQSAAAGLQAIKEKDPNFDERAFLDHAQTAFFKLQQAWTARNQDLARDVMSDSLYERHKLQTDQLIANHQIDVLENIVIGHARVVAAEAGPAYDSITVAFTASMTDYTIDEHTKQVVDGSTYPQTFTEFWTFIRRAGQQSKAADTALASTCPSCGAPLKLTDGRCDFCGAPVRTSSSDWVVDTIEQA